MAPPQPPWPSTEPDRNERIKLALAVTGLVFFTLLGWLLLSYFSRILDLLYSLWGILLVLALIGSAIAFFVALAFALGRKRPPTAAEAPATLDAVETRQV